MLRHACLFMLMLGLLAVSPVHGAEKPGETGDDHDRAVAALRALAAEVDVKVVAGRVYTRVTMVSGNWKGNADDLAHLGRLSNLIYLSITGVPLADDDLRHIQFLTSLEVLHMRSAKITDEGLSHLGQLHKLKYLGLQNTDITVEGLKHLKGLSKLKTMWVGGTMIRNDLKKAREICPQVGDW